MRRAGAGEEDAAAIPDETSFAAGEDVVENGDAHTAETLRAGTLAPKDRFVPIEAPPPNPHDDVQILDVIRVLLGRWRLIASVVISSLGLAVAYNYQATPIYETRARLLIEPDSPQIVPFRPVTEDTARFDYFYTQFEVLRSRALAKLTLERLGLLSNDPAVQSGQIGSFLGSLSVSPVRSTGGGGAVGESRVVNIIFRSRDPQRAARYANGLAQTYVDQNVETRRQKSREASAWLKERLDELR
jgi:uncharacterized protein involved in exopolysaccharide biosynthesis